MDVSASDIREVRFGTTRVKAGYDISEVDQFLDRVEKAIAAYAESYQRAQDEADALRSQVQQVQNRLESTQSELDEVRNQASSTPHPQAPDIESTAENPVVVVESAENDTEEALVDLRRIRDEVRDMLERQLDLVATVRLPDAQS